MKTIKIFTASMLLSITTTTSFTACSQDDDRLAEVASASAVAPQSRLSNVEIVEAGEFDLSDYVDTRAMAFDIIQDGKGSRNFAYEYKYATMRYTCHGADGSVKKLSELLVCPKPLGKSRPLNYIIGCHSTITSNKERPTNFKNHPHLSETNMLALFTNYWSQQALVVMPDYEGYGCTAGDPHPYCNRELTAEQVIEGARAALEWFEAKEGKMADGWRSVAIGYSQGGAVAAGVLRYYQEHHLTDLRLVGAVCGDGPYDPLATLKQYIADDKLYMPVAPTLLLKGAIDTNPELQRLGCTYQDFVTDQFYQTGIFSWIAGKQMTTDDIQAGLLRHSMQHGDQGGFTMMCAAGNDFYPYTPSNARDAQGRARKFTTDNGHGKNYATVSQVLKPAVIAYFKEGRVTGDVPEAKLKALEHALAMNRLTDGGFKPGAGFSFFHSTRDEVVPYCNYESVRDSWTTATLFGKPYTSNTYLHVGTGTTFFASYCGSMVDNLLKNKWAPGESPIGGRWW